MSDVRLSRDSIQQLVSQASRQITQVAGTAAGQQAGQILNELLNEASESQFEGSAVQGKIADRVPNALERLQSQLKSLGVDAATAGEVLNQLNALLGKGRRMRREKTLKAALKKQGGLMSQEDEAALQDAIDSQADAADLMSSLAEAQDMARKGRMGKL